LKPKRAEAILRPLQNRVYPQNRDLDRKGW
jgi:hypothetical protein